MIADEKRQIIKRSALLDMLKTSKSIEDIGGLDNLKKWLKKKEFLFKEMKRVWRRYSTRCFIYAYLIYFDFY